MNARSILGILTLAVGVDANITVTVSGMDAEETMTKLVSAFENEFED